MSRTTVQVVLAATFVAAFAVQLVVIMAIPEKMWPEEQLALIVRLLAIYSVPGSIVLCGILVRRRTPKRGGETWLGLVALLLVVLWNALFVARTLRLATAGSGGDSVTAALSYFDNVSAGGAWLIAGALTMYFGAKERPAAPAG